MAKPRKRKSVKVRRPMPPPSKVMPDSRRRIRDRDIERLLRRWKDEENDK
jgi:hypothetical protein